MARLLGAAAALVGLATAAPQPPRAAGRPLSMPSWGHPGRVVFLSAEPLRDSGELVGWRVLERRAFPAGAEPDFLPMLTAHALPGLVGLGRIKFVGRSRGVAFYERDARHLPWRDVARALATQGDGAARPEKE